MSHIPYKTVHHIDQNETKAEKKEDRSDKDKDFETIVTENGFRFESYSVTTADGYILTVYRIPGLQNTPN